MLADSVMMGQGASLFEDFHASCFFDQPIGFEGFIESQDGYCKVKVDTNARCVELGDAVGEKRSTRKAKGAVFVTDHLVTALQRFKT